ncbi:MULTISPECIES: hypothetical protein [unclassified Tolypothrix]|uniref:hypothetical protein n=1 Tax=unclassified Tolypothrix TaxID=2649714 RepID=UPI0005EAC253|nr:MULTISPECIES: hypothetical protein [unclassified Tolypothrix]EKE98904.1 hypothetical protein FDUTEX481_03536 [Tolypothrix sp. PCC 7601]BAY90275.1 hypothetical protein NIES3275_22870 [Microchaete diplosiphon NIES-3275]
MKLPNMGSYCSEEIGISISLPEYWHPQVINQWQFRIFGLPEPGFEEYFEEYRSTMSYLLAEPENNSGNWFEILITDSGNKIQEDYNEYQLISEESCHISGHKAYIRQYEWTEITTSLRLSQLQSLIYNDSSSFYLINAATLKPLEAKYMPVFREILHSTQIISSDSSN